SGTTVWQWAYAGNPWGELDPTSTTGYTYNLRFPGQYYDVETGLMYNGARYFDSARGGFDQPDPSGFNGGIDLYVYGLNNPLMYVDPSGLSPPGVPPPMGPFLPPPWAELELPRTPEGFPEPLTPAACVAAYSREKDATAEFEIDQLNECATDIPNPDDPNGPVMCRVNVGAMWSAADYVAGRHLKQCVASCK
ncbi:RHS repeat-associated core domain-containing protein, partial [Rhodanobacter sp. Si-c]